MFGGIALSLIFFLSSAWALPLSVAASIAPLCSLIHEVGGERVKVIQLIPNGANPHAYEPTPGEVKKLEEAQAIFLIGLGFDTMFERLLGDLKKTKAVFSVSEGIEVLTDVFGHSHGEEEGEHEEEDEKVGYPDPHVWVSLRNAQRIVQTITKALTQIDPEGKTVYEENAARYIRRLQELDEYFREKFASLRNRAFVASHNAWSYVARDYGLQLKGVIERAPEREPTPQEIAQLITLMREEGVKMVFAEVQFNQKLAQLLTQETGATIILLDPLGSFPEKPYLELMKQNLTAILQGFTSP